MKPSLPVVAIVLATVTMAALAITGLHPLLALAGAILWIASLWIGKPDPQPATSTASPHDAEIAAISAYLEPISQPLLLIDSGRVVASNQAARNQLGAHLVGQDARLALRHPQAVQLLSAETLNTVEVAGFAGPRTVWQISRWPVSRRMQIVECVDRTGEADVSRAHTDFVANASHELRTPLASILGYLETLADGDATLDGTARQRFISIMTNEARRMHSLIEDLMSLSRIEAEKHNPPDHAVNLGKLVATVIQDVQSVQGKGRVTFNGECASATIAGDSRQIEQLIRNLIDNALKYGAPDKPVAIKLAQHNGALRLTVADQGAGIEPQHLPHLTRRFYRTDPGRSRSAGGTGLGLAIVKHIAERHRAQLNITSALGSGTQVTVDFRQFEG